MMHVYTADEAKLAVQIREDLVQVRVEEDTVATYLEVAVTPDYAFDGSEYVLFPACCYKGNQFDVLKSLLLLSMYRLFPTQLL